MVQLCEGIYPSTCRDQINALSVAPRSVNMSQNTVAMIQMS